MGGMALGAGLEQWGLHRRIALLIMHAIGTEPRRLLFGMLVATAAVSLWISNTATAVMMVPIGMALLAQLQTVEGRKLEHFGASLMLAVAYGANIGGIGTKHMFSSKQTLWTPSSSRTSEIVEQEQSGKTKRTRRTKR